MPLEITAQYFIQYGFPWVLLLVLALGLKWGAVYERARWMDVVTEAAHKDRYWRFEWVREHAIQVSGAPVEPVDDNEFAEEKGPTGAAAASAFLEGTE